MKAFLSHSSLDKEIVRTIAKELGRQYCIYDEFHFTNGREFKKSIEDGLEESSIFILFASMNSQESLWVQFEIEEAWYKKLYKNLSKALVYIVDEELRIDSLPNWLTRTLIKREKSPKIIARDIRHHLDKLLMERNAPYFVGRSSTTEELEQYLMPLDGSQAPKVLFITGLPGIGRRTFIKKAMPSIYGFNKFIEIEINDGDNIKDICIKIADYVEPYTNLDAFKNIIKEIRDNDESSAVTRIISNLKKIVSIGELPIFLDSNGLLNNDGYIYDYVKQILINISPQDDIYLVFISHRRPQFTSGVNVPILQIFPLKNSDTKRLLTILANRNNVKINSLQIEELSEYVAGYPPAAYFSIQQARTYGIELVMNDKSRLMQFRTTIFLRHFAEISLNKTEKDILRLLATFNPLPFEVILNTVDIEINILQSILIKMIDLSFVNISDAGYYKIASPIADPAIHAFDFPSSEENDKTAKNLSAYIEKHNEEISHLELSRVLFKAAQLSKNTNLSESAVHLASDLILLTETLYHSRNYESVIETGLIALSERPNCESARQYVIKAYIKLEKYDYAENQIQELKKVSSLRDIYYLNGFLERNRNNFGSAIDYYEKSLKTGYHGAAIYRELSMCHYNIGNVEEAFRYINLAKEKHSENKYIIDLLAQISIQLGNEKSALDALKILESINEKGYYYHRLSRFHLAFHRSKEALESAIAAKNSFSKVPFEVLAQYILCLIEMQQYSEAETTIDFLDRSFNKIKKDIRFGLRCKCGISKGNFKDVLLFSEQISDKNTDFYKRIRRDAIEGGMLNDTFNSEEKYKYKIELDNLKIVNSKIHDLLMTTDLD